MKGTPTMVRLTVAMALAGAGGAPAFALPTMIRLGYSECASCHISPQGGGLLNEYGRAIDQAQSLLAGDYRPSDNDVVRALSAQGRITHDVRAVFQAQARWADAERAPGSFRPRIMYRNATDLGHGLRLSAVVTADGERAPRPTLSYDPPTQSSAVFLNTALLQYRASGSIELAVGRDQLPTGVNVPDLAGFTRARNRVGYYDAPTQLKMFWWGKRHAITPFVYAPGGNEVTGDREFGAGGLYEFDVLGNQRTKLGLSVLRGTAHNGDRRMLGAYARLGFGRWGLLGEHDVTDRSRNVPNPVSFRQQATYGQVFWAAREWLVISGIGERLRVAAPFEAHRAAGRLEIAARLASQASVVVRAGTERDMLTGRLTKSVALQVALKTVD